MRILVVGGGGREHALVWKIAQSPLVKEIYCAPGNAGISRIARCVPIRASDIEGLAQFAKEKGIDLTVVGPEEPLVLGLEDAFRKRGLRVFGPSERAAILEGSKSFAKELMRRYSIPTAEFEVFEDPQEAFRYAMNRGGPLVVKADGLAAGKGVFVCRDTQEAVEAIDRIMVKKAFGEAGGKVVIEEYLEGEEASFIAVTDGEDVLPFPPSQDHKRALDGDLGPNTGGMGAYSPAPVVTGDVAGRIMKEIMIPTVRAMAEEGRPYKGFLYAGLMITQGIPKVLEFNVRMGDPEAQPLLVRLKSDLVPVLVAALEQGLKGESLLWDSGASVCVVMASQGYPGPYEKGKRIFGLEEAEAQEGTVVFHAGTRNEGGTLVTDGGRVLGVTALGRDVKEAVERAYRAVEKITWEGAYYRKDIGKRALDRKSSEVSYARETQGAYPHGE